MASASSGIDSSPSQQDIDALARLSSEGKHGECLERVAALLAIHPRSAALLSLAGFAHYALELDAAALECFDALLALEPENAFALIDRANCLANLGRLDEAVLGYEAAIRIQPDNAVVHSNCAMVLYLSRRLDEALERSRAAVALRPEWPDPHFVSGNALKDMGRLQEALDAYDRAIALRPDFALAYCNRGLALTLMDRREEALASLAQAIHFAPDDHHAYVNRGNLLLERDQPEAALADYEQVLRLQPERGESYFLRANAQKSLHRSHQAMADYDKAIALDPGHIGAWNNRGLALAEMNCLDEALESYDRALALAPGNASALSNRGFLLRSMNRPEEALASLDQAIECDPRAAGAYYNRAVVLCGLQRLDEAIADFDRSIALNPDKGTAISQMLYHRSHICDWSEMATRIDLARLGIDGEPFSPLALLAAEDQPARHLERARVWARQADRGMARLACSEAAPDGKIRLGYFSADLNNHAVAYLIARVFELHDREKFEIFGYSFGTDPWDAMRRRISEGVDHFHDVSKLSDEAAAALARSHGIDIGIDLTGYTQDERPGIFAYQAAPVQINYLGYPGSMGAEFIDYIIADPVLIPESHRQFYSEKIIYLPHSYQANDDRRAISAASFSRSELGLPEAGFVFCSFNANFKITPREFDIWMRLLGQVDGSVLWLLKGNEWSQANLRREALARGIDPQRLVFAEKMPLADHLARHRCADLFLDTFNYNAHTTGSDALWAGLPFVTRLGEGFAARVGASLLTAVGLGELITRSDAEYESLILHLAHAPGELARIRQNLANNLPQAPLFASERFTRHIEQAYELVLERRRAGIPAEHVIVAA